MEFYLIKRVFWISLVECVSPQLLYMKCECNTDQEGNINNEIHM